MYESWIIEIRNRIRNYGWRRTLLGRRKRDIGRETRREGIDESLHREYARLIEQGDVVWASIAQVNELLFDSNELDAPANILFSLDSYFDSRPNHLIRIAKKVQELKGTFPKEPALAKIAAVMTDEQNYILNWRLPYRVTDGHSVYIAHSLLHRSRLPNGGLPGPIIPLVVSKTPSISNMLAPLSCWPEDLVRDPSALSGDDCYAGKLASRRITEQQHLADTQDAIQHPHKRLVSDDVVPGASRQLLTLTPRCADFFKSIAAEGKLGKNWHVSLGGNADARTLDLSNEPISHSHTRVESQSVILTFPTESTRYYRGVVIDYRDCPVAPGIQFIEPD